MLWKRVLGITLILACSFAFLFPAQGYADDESSWIDPYNNLFKFHNVGEGLGDERPLFLKHSILKYWFDIDLEWVMVPGWGFTYMTLNVVLSSMMQIMGFICIVVIFLADWALNYQGLDGLADYVENFVRKLLDTLFFGELFGVMIFFLGVSLIFSFGRNEDVAGKLLKVIVNLVIAFTLMANMSLIIRGINSIGKIGSDAVFTAFAVLPGEVTKYTNDDARNAMLSVYDGFFNNNFYKPWQLANYGLIVPEGKDLTPQQQQVKDDSDKHLNGNIVQNYLTEPIKEAGESITRMFKSMANAILPKSLEFGNGSGFGYITSTPLGIPFRFFVVMFTFIIGSSYGLLLLAIAGTTIFGKLVMLLLAMIAPLIFLLILIPDWGDEVLLNWVKGMIAAGTYWIVASLMLVMILFMQQQIYEVSDSWLITMFLQLILLFTVFRFRNLIWEYIPISQMAMMNAAETAFFEKGKEAVDKTKEMAIEGGALLALGGAAVATGNPAMLSSLGRTRMGSIGKGIFEDAASMRREAASKGLKKPGMTKALGKALLKQLGYAPTAQHEGAYYHHSQRQSLSQSDQENRSETKAEHSVGENIEAATQRVAAALHQLASDVERISPSGSREMYTELGRQPIGDGHYAVFDNNNRELYQIKGKDVIDSRTNERIGEIRNNQVISPSGTEIGRIKNGQLQIQESTGHVKTGKIYTQSTSSSVSTQSADGQIIRPKVVVDPIVELSNKNPVLTVDPTYNIKAKSVEVNPEVNVKGKRVELNPEYHVNQAEKVNVRPEFNIENSKVDLDVTTNVTQHNTITGGGGGSSGSSSTTTPSPPPPQPQTQPINLNVNTSGSSGEKVHITQENHGDDIHVNVQSPDLSFAITGNPKEAKSEDEKNKSHDVEVGDSTSIASLLRKIFRREKGIRRKKDI